MRIGLSRATPSRQTSPLALIAGAFLVGLIELLAATAQARTYVSFEGASLWQTRNDQRVPGEGGTLFSISQISQGPFPSYRVYAGVKWQERHELRVLYAPLLLELATRFNAPVTYMNTVFAADTDTTVGYKFNSYRLTYAYHLPKSGAWNFAWGFTGKIRDAEVSIQQGSLRESKANVGFVPLLNFQATRELGNSWSFRFDFDGLAAPQGRAFDIAIFLESSILGSKTGPEARIFGGYRTLEGGADNKEVYNFAWLHYAVIGLRAQL